MGWIGYDYFNLATWVGILVTSCSKLPPYKGSMILLRVLGVVATKGAS